MKEEEIGFALLGIKTEQFAIFEENYSSKKEMQITSELEFKLNPESQQIGVYIGFDFKQSKKVFLTIQVGCHFKLSAESYEALITEDKSKIIVPKGFLAHLSMISTGTARGVLVAKTESTEFSRFLVPLLNVTEMIKEDAVFELTKK